MKPDINFYNCDCMDHMAKCENNKYDLAIVDPPYGIQGANLKGFKKKNIQHEQHEKCKKWDNIPSDKYFKELLRVSRDQIIWGCQYFTKFLPSFSQPLIWDKGTGDNYFADGEMAFCSIKGTLRFFRHQWCGAFKDSERGNKAIHINQKPIALYKWCLQKYANRYEDQCDKILDTHGGSMSIAIACHDMGFDLDLCELDKDYFDAGKKRYEKHISQVRMF